jgi:hypothetical protein
MDVPQPGNDPALSAAEEKKRIRTARNARRRMRKEEERAKQQASAAEPPRSSNNNKNESDKKKPEAQPNPKKPSKAKADRGQPEKRKDWSSDRHGQFKRSQSRDGPPSPKKGRSWDERPRQWSASTSTSWRTLSGSGPWVPPWEAWGSWEAWKQHGGGAGEYHR